MLLELAFATLLSMHEAYSHCVLQGYVSIEARQLLIDADTVCKEVTWHTEGLLIIVEYIAPHNRTRFSFTIPKTIGTNTPFWYRLGATHVYLRGIPEIPVHSGPLDPT